MVLVAAVAIFVIWRPLQGATAIRQSWTDAANGDLAGAAEENRAAYDLAQANYETTSKATVPEEVQKAELEVRAAVFPMLQRRVQHPDRCSTGRVARST